MQKCKKSPGYIDFESLDKIYLFSAKKQDEVSEEMSEQEEASISSNQMDTVP